NRIGTILARRGEPGVWEYLDDAMAAADGTGEPHNVGPVRLVRAEAYWLEGKTAEAIREAELADEAVDPRDAWPPGAVAASAAPTRTLPAPRRRAGRTLPASGQRPLGEGRPAVQRPGLPVRGRAGLAGRAGRGCAAEGARRVHQPRRDRRGAARPAEAARARRPLDPGRPQVRDQGEPARAHPARARGPRGDLRRAEQRGHRREAVHLGQDRRSPRLRRPRQARRAEP